MKLGGITATVKTNLDELVNLVCEAKELIQRINDFELEVEVVKKKNRK